MGPRLLSEMKRLLTCSSACLNAAIFSSCVTLWIIPRRRHTIITQYEEKVRMAPRASDPILSKMED